jgi:hypothetical protein
MTLREEIYNELESVTNFRVHKDDLNKSTDKIISKIEKKIAEMPPASSTQRFIGNKDTGKALAYTAGYEDA